MPVCSLNTMRAWQAVSLPLYKKKGKGSGAFQAFWYGQLSGMVEPVGGLLGAIFVQVAEPVLPYALSFAGGAMVFVVAHDLIPESSSHGNTDSASVALMIGFCILLALDVPL